MTTTKEPCTVCRRHHRPPMCLPGDGRARRVLVSLPAHVARELAELPRGDRSATVARLLEQHLDRLDHDRSAEDRIPDLMAALERSVNEAKGAREHKRAGVENGSSAVDS